MQRHKQCFWSENDIFVKNYSYGVWLLPIEKKKSNQATAEI